MLDYIKIDNWLWRELSSRPTDLSLFTGLCFHRDVDTNETHPIRVSEIAKEVGISRREVYRCIDRLKKRMLIEEVSHLKGVFVWKLSCLDWHKNGAQRDWESQVCDLVSHFKI